MVRQRFPQLPLGSAFTFLIIHLAFVAMLEKGGPWGADVLHVRHKL